MEPLYLVDGSGYIFRAYFAVRPLSNEAGLPTNALFGFARMLMKLLRDLEARYIAVTFDTGEPTFRHKMYSEYKANRDACPEDLVPQMPYFRKIVQAFGLPSLEKPGFEADDIIGTLATRFATGDQKVVVVSGDKDLCQLVNKNIEVWDPMRDVRFTPEAVKEKFGVLPEQIRDYLALIGDSSDNIPGVRGVGPKTAVRLIEHFGNIEALLGKASEIEGIAGLRGAKTLRTKIESELETLRLSQELVNLDLKVEPFNSVQSLEEYSWKSPKKELLQPLFEELEFTRMLEESLGISRENGRSSESESKKEKDFQILPLEGLADFAAELAKQDSFAFDTETSSLDPLDCELIGISFSWEDGKAYYLPTLSVAEPERCFSLPQLLEVLGPIFSNPEIQKYGCNLKFDISVLEEKGFQIAGVGFDAFLASYVLYPDRRQHGLKHLTLKYLGETMASYEETLGDSETLAEAPLDRVGHYAAYDAEASFRLRDILIDELAKKDGDGSKLLRAYEDIEVPLVEVLSTVERNGIAVDVPFLASLEKEFREEISLLERQIHSLSGVEFNLNSPKQLAEVLFQDLGIPTKGVKKTKTGFSTDASVLSKIQDQHEIVPLILDYREVHKLNSTYVEALQRLVHPKTGRIHTSFNQGIAATGRLSSSDPNLQNIPIRNPRGRRIRQAFVAKEGCKLIAADYSQIELRILAHLSGDESLIEAFQQGEDIHARTAREIFGTGLMADDEFARLRRVAKTINFGIIYGMSAFRLAGELGVSRKQAQEYIEGYFGRYPKVRGYFADLEAALEGQGYVETLHGRRRYLHELDTSGRDAGYASRSLMNAPIQGSAAEVIKLAMVHLHRRLLSHSDEVKMVLQVHDELVFEVKEARAEEFEAIVVEEMEAAVRLDVPLKVDSRISQNWGSG